MGFPHAKVFHYQYLKASFAKKDTGFLVRALQWLCSIPVLMAGGIVEEWHEMMVLVAGRDQQY